MLFPKQLRRLFTTAGAILKLNLKIQLKISSEIDFCAFRSTIWDGQSSKKKFGSFENKTESFKVFFRVDVGMEEKINDVILTFLHPLQWK